MKRLRRGRFLYGKYAEHARRMQGGFPRGGMKNKKIRDIFENAENFSHFPIAIFMQSAV